MQSINRTSTAKIDRLYADTLAELDSERRPSFDPRPRRFPALAKALAHTPPARLDGPAENIWIWSDLHLGHALLIDNGARPFANVHDMAARLLANWWEAVDEQGIVLVLGDLAMGPALDSAGRFLRSGPGEVCLVLGNHDITDSARIRIEGYDAMAGMLYCDGPPPLVFTHVPLAEVPDGWVNVHGHTHTESSADTAHICVCVEQLNYRPVSLASLMPLAAELAQGNFPAGDTTAERVEAVAATLDLTQAITGSAAAPV